MAFSKAREAYAYQIERQFSQAQERIIMAFRSLEAETINLGELTYFDAQTKINLQTKLASLRSKYLEIIRTLPKKTLSAEIMGETD